MSRKSESKPVASEMRQDWRDNMNISIGHVTINVRAYELASDERVPSKRLTTNACCVKIGIRETIMYVRSGIVSESMIMGSSIRSDC